MALKREQIRLLSPDQELITKCRRIKDWAAATRTAGYVKNETREDGAVYVVSTDSTEGVVSVKVVPANPIEGTVSGKEIDTNTPRT